MLPPVLSAYFFSISVHVILISFYFIDRVKMYLSAVDCDATANTCPLM